MPNEQSYILLHVQHNINNQRYIYPISNLFNVTKFQIHIFNSIMYNINNKRQPCPLHLALVAHLEAKRGLFPLCFIIQARREQSSPINIPSPSCSTTRSVAACDLRGNNRLGLSRQPSFTQGQKINPIPCFHALV